MSSESFIMGWPDLRQRILELVESGQSAAVEVLLTEHSGLRDHEQLLIDCIYAEFCFREEHGQTPEPADYLNRFPDCVDQLLALFEVHEALGTRDSVGSSADSPQHPAKVNQALDPTKLDKSPAQANSGNQASSRQIGPYKLLQLIGEGGMGAVYMADQLEPVKRRVALKVIKSGMDSRQVVARFEAERQALAMMDHQNIAKVLDAGITEDGTPYFAMELVQGMPITKYCDRQKLSIPDRLKLFVQVCRALQHAHQKGVIHRDIKPSNVLVTQRDGVPVAKVIDFGLAKAMQSENRLTDKTLFTEVGQVCGTLEYMSPEQAEMNELGLDTRTDVYSLGVLLYELLTGSTPLGHDRVIRAAFHRVLELIITEEAPRPSRRLSESGDAITGISDHRRIEPRRLNGILKRELDWIALKALEKDRDRRYDGAGLLADDVQHYLDGEVVTARPPSTGYRLRKAIRKHRVAFVSGTVFVLLLLAGLIGTGTMWFRAQQEAARASRAEAETKLALSDVEVQRQAAIDEANRAQAAERTATKETSNARLAEAKAKESESKALQSESAAIAAKEHTDATLARSNYFLAQARWEENRVDDAREILQRVPKKHRNFEWYFTLKTNEGSGVTCYGHTERISSVSFSPDGTRIASGSRDNTIKLWDTATGEEITTFTGHTGTVRCVSFSPDGTRIASASGDNTIKLWDAATGKEIITFNGDTDGVSSVSFSPDGTRIALGCGDNTIKLWDAATGEEITTFEGHTSPVNSVSFSPDGTRIASGEGKRFSRGEIKLWDAATGKQITTFKGHTERVLSVSFSPDGTRIASGSFDNTIKLWDTATGEEITTLTGHTDGVISVSFSPDGTRIASGSGDNTIMLWDAATGKEIITFKGHTDGVSSVSFSPDGTRIASGSGDNTVKLWDAATDAEVTIFKGHTDHIADVSFSPDGTRIASGSFDNTIKLWDAATGEEITTLKGHTFFVFSVDFSPDGTRIASASGDNTIKLWDAATGKEIITFNGDTDGVSSVSFSPDGTRIALGCGDNTIKLWDAATGEEITTFEGHTSPVNSVSFSPDGTRIASGCSDNTVKLWDAASGEEITTLKGRIFSVGTVSFSPDGRHIASGSTDNTVKQWDAATGEEITTFKGHTDDVSSVSFSPDGTRIASGSSDGTVKLWDAATGEEISTFKGHTAYVSSVSFSPDGTRIASASSDETVRLWDAPKGEEITTFRGHTGTVRCVSFSPDGTRIASGAWDNTIRLWDAATGKQLTTFRGHNFEVLCVSFSPNSARISSHGNDGKQMSWDVGTGKVFSENISDQSIGGITSNRSPDGHWLAVPQQNNVLLVDLVYKKTPREKLRREALARPKPRWHKEQSLAAESAKQWYAAAFHRAWLMKFNPSDGLAYDDLHETHRKLIESNNGQAPPVPAIVSEMLQLSRGSDLPYLTK